MTSATATVYDTPQAELGEEIPTERSGWFGFKGRLGVLGYMARAGILLFALLAVMGIAAGVFYAFFYDGRPIEEYSGLAVASFVALFFVFYIVVCWSSLALLAQRLHDINMSGWWMLLLFVPILGMLFFLFVALKPGQAQANRFGHPVEANGWEKPMGIAGLILCVGFTIAYVAYEVAGYLGLADAFSFIPAV